MHEKPSPEAVPLRGVPDNFDLLVPALLRFTCHSASRVPLGTQILSDVQAKSTRTEQTRKETSHDHSVILFAQSPRKTF